MARWLPRVLARIRRLTAEGNVRFTEKALGERDSAGRVLSPQTAEWLYIFKPRIGEVVVYVKVVLRRHCRVISFHEAGNDDDRNQGQSAEA